MFILNKLGFVPQPSLLVPVRFALNVMAIFNIVCGVWNAPYRAEEPRVSFRAWQTASV